MIGVILWSNKDRSRAVIWCEDHKDLAFYQADAADPAHLRFGTGDLVRFDLSCSDATRIVERPELLSEHEAPFLAAALKAASAGLRRDMGSLPVLSDSICDEARDDPREATGIIPFDPDRRTARLSSRAENPQSETPQPGKSQPCEVLWRVFG